MTFALQVVKVIFTHSFSLGVPTVLRRMMVVSALACCISQGMQGVHAEGEEARPRRRAMAAVAGETEGVKTGGRASVGDAASKESKIDANGVAEISFRELFKSTSGGEQLQYTDRAKELAGKPVRITGYIVRQSQPIPWAFLFSPVPQSVHERDYGLCDDLPVTALHVFLPRSAQPIPPRYSGPVNVTGILELGGREEADGRSSVARVRVTAPVAVSVVPAVPKAAVTTASK